MLVIAVTALLILGIFGEPIKKAFAAVTNPLLKKIGLEDGSEQQIVEQELLENAKEVFNNFKNVIEQCKNSQDLRCSCGQIDFTGLNRYKISLSNNRDTRNSFLQLLNSQGLPVKVGSPPIDPTPIDNSPTLPKDIYENHDEFEEYQTNNNNFIFSIENVIYIKADRSEEEKFSGKMNRIYFSKPSESRIIFNDEEFSGECINLYEGSIVHLKIDPRVFPTKTWNFHLTNNPAHHGRSGFSPNYCNVYATNEEGGFFQDDEHSVWSINPGGRIAKVFSPQEDIHNIFKGLEGYIAGISDNNKASPYYIAGEETIGEELYIIHIGAPNTECQADDPDFECMLFVRALNNGFQFYYWPQYGLICDNDKKWKACNDNSIGARKTIGQHTYECTMGTYLSFDYYTWRNLNA